MIRTERQADGAIDAVADVVVGVDVRQVRVPLGRFAGEVEPGGLRGTPVVVVIDEALEGLVRRGAERSGHAAVASSDPGGEPPGAALLTAASDAEVVVARAGVEGACETIVIARALGGRPLPVVPLDDEAAATAMLGACWVDLDVAAPALDGPDRTAARRAIDALGLFERHHVVEVDPRPAFEHGASASATLHALAAGATGVLAGRIAAANRRWR